MGRYHIQEADFQIGEGWADQSLNIFKLPATGSTKPASVVVGRDPLSRNRGLVDYVSEQLANARQRLPHFLLSRQVEAQLDGQLAVIVDYHWEQDHRPLSIRQVYLKRVDTALIFTLTTAPEDFTHYLPTFEALCESIHLQTSTAR